MPLNACTTTVDSSIRVIKSNAIVKNFSNLSMQKTISAIWDTGCTNTTISKKVANDLGLTPVGKIQTNTGGGVCDAIIYIVTIVLPNNVILQNRQVSCLENLDVDMLIGMDIISLGQFTISSKNGLTMMSFVTPALELKDYIKDLKAIDKKNNKNLGRNDPCSCGSGKKYKNCCWDKINH